MFLSVSLSVILSCWLGVRARPRVPMEPPPHPPPHPSCDVILLLLHQNVYVEEQQGSDLTWDWIRIDHL